MKRFLKPVYALPVTALLLILVLVSGVVSHMTALSSGREILVDARGYDPRDILLGHYVQIRPKTEQVLSAEKSQEIIKRFGLEPGHSQTETVWVTGEMVDGSWQITDVSQTAPSRDAASLKVPTRLYVETNAAGRQNLTVQPYLFFDRFYTNQAEALRLEQSLREEPDNVKLIVSVAPDGQARLKGMDVNGERTVTSWW